MQPIAAHTLQPDVAFDGGDLDRDEPVVQQQRVACTHVARQ
jgi:hypothetical protein